MRRFLSLLLLSSLVVACSDDGIAPAEVESVSTFDTDLDQWVALALGLAPGTGFIVEPTLGRVRLELNATDSGGVGVIARAFLVPPETDYRVELDFVAESSDGPSDPWTIVVGSSVEGAPFDFVDAFSTATLFEGEPTSLPLSGSIPVSAGAATGPDGTESEVRIAIGFRPESAGNRIYGLDDIVVRFLPR